jgi:hypothetical protein
LGRKVTADGTFQAEFNGFPSMGNQDDGFGTASGRCVFSPAQRSIHNTRAARGIRFPRENARRDKYGSLHWV